MAKKKKTSVAPLLTLVAALLGVVGLIMLFLPAIGVKDTDTTYNGLKVVFGYKEKVLGQEVAYFNFSFMNLLTYLLVIGGTVLSILNVIGKKPNKLFSLIAAACFVVAAIFFFCTVSFTAFNEDAKSVVSFLGGDIKDAYKLAIGSILGGIVSILGAASSVGSVLLK